MTLDTPDTGAVVPADDAGPGESMVTRVDDVTVELPTGEWVRVCADENCDETFIVNKRGLGINRKYCAEHLSTGGGRGQPKRKPGTKDKRPPSVRVQVGGGRSRAPKGDPELAAVQQRVEQVVGIGAGLLALAGGEHGPADALDINAGKAELAAAIAGLAEFYPVIRKLAAGGEASAKATAWFRLVVALVAMLVPVLVRHGAVPDSIAQFLALADVHPAPDSTREPVAA